MRIGDTSFQDNLIFDEDNIAGKSFLYGVVKSFPVDIFYYVQEMYFGFWVAEIRLKEGLYLTEFWYKLL